MKVFVVFANCGGYPVLAGVFESEGLAGQAIDELDYSDCWIREVELNKNILKEVL